LPSFVDSWNQACSNRDTSAMDRVRRDLTEMLPEQSLGERALSEMSNCIKATCVQMEPQLALVRLKTRVDPEIPPSLRDLLRRSPATVRVRIRIDEKGDVTISQTAGDNNILNQAVRTAVARWKFHPAIVQGQTRCVDTEIPIVINAAAPNAF